MADGNLYDLSFLNKISGGDVNFIREMISTFKEVAPEYLRKAHECMMKDSVDVLSRETHRFIPGVSFLGAKQLENDLLIIEEYTKKHENLEQVPVLLERVETKIRALIESFDRDFN